MNSTIHKHNGVMARINKKIAFFIFAVGISIMGFSQVSFQKLFKGSGDEEANSVDVCADGGYIVAGYTTSAGQGGKDMLIMKLDSIGNLHWSKTFGGGMMMLRIR